MGANEPIEDIEATLLAATKSASRGAFAPTGSFSSGFNIGGPLGLWTVTFLNTVHARERNPLPRIFAGKSHPERGALARVRLEVQTGIQYFAQAFHDRKPDAFAVLSVLSSGRRL